MILYFADRQMNIIGQASTNLPGGLIVINDLLTEDVETGTRSFECIIPFNDSSRIKAANCTDVGNFVLRSVDGGECELYTIIDSNVDTGKREANLYAEDAGMDLLNEVFGPYEAEKAYPITHYIEKYAGNAGFQIGINEVSTLTRKLTWDGEATAQERVLSVANQFDGCEISFSFVVDGLSVARKYINVFKKRGQDTGVQLRLNYEIDKIITTKSIYNLATALHCTGGTLEGSDDPITLLGYSYDDGDFYVDGDTLKSREALKKWARLLWKDDGTQQAGGHITKIFSWDTTSQATLCAHAITELKKIRDAEVNYECDITRLPPNVKVGDRVNIIDDAGGLYLSTRLLKRETSIANSTNNAVLGDFLIKGSGISQKVAKLADEFAKLSISATRALSIANNAHSAANDAQEKAETAVSGAAAAQSAADAAQEAANQATQSAEAAQSAANNAQAAVETVENSVSGLETTIADAQAAATQAKQAAETAQTMANEAHTAATTAQTKAQEAATAAGAAQTTADTAVSNAATAQSTAETAKSQAEAAATTAAAAKADAEAAQADIDAFGDDLTTLSNTMAADYARKTDLTEATANLQTQITQNAAGISSNASAITTIDETANNAAEQAAAAQTTAAAAQAEANQAKADAEASQAAANEAAAAAAAAQTEADNAKLAAATAKGVADKAAEDLAAAEADLATVQGRVDATEADIAAAEAAVAEAKTAAETAKADATAAAETAAAAQETANTAVTNAENAKKAADDAASKADAAQATADAAQGDASAAQAKADAAAETAAAAQETANTAVTNATAAQNKADQAAAEAAAAQTAADAADAKAAAAAEDLAEAQQNLEDVTSRVDATEAEVEAAKADVVAAQQAADKAKADAFAAQSTADTAKANADAAQSAADTAKAAADAAQADATAAQQAADAAQADVDALAVRVTNSETNIIQNAEAIIMNALENYVETSNYQEFKSTVESQFAIMADEIAMNFTTTTEQITNIDGDMQSKFAEFYKHISFSDDGISISSGNSVITLQLDNELGIIFKKNDIAFGRWDGTDFYTGNIVVEVNERAQLGNFAFVPRSDGSLSFLKVG